MTDPSLEAMVRATLARTDPVERAAFLDQLCAGDARLRQQIENQLLAASTDDGFRANGAEPSKTGVASFSAGETWTVHLTGDPPPPTSMPVPESSHQTIADKYHLVEMIGEGGMGAVWKAWQSDPVRRWVALKLIRAGMASSAVSLRFEAERQALALMEHPNIAHIFDGGVTATGQPFFAMEWVQGAPLNEYCDQKRLTIQERVALLVTVCKGVQHAHQKGIIHRDLKPGNVLVTEVDGQPVPKVIDFGVAKAIDQKLTEQTYTDLGTIVGTPSYMSPEQADADCMDIDTRTDVYSLGVVLYELLVGAPPFEVGGPGRGGGIFALFHMVRQVEPLRPSVKVANSDTPVRIARNRSTDPIKLIEELRGELDWVVMKALEKDRARRYDTANGLARDLERYLADEVVEARPPSTAYRLRKIVRRYKVQVFAAALVALSLVAGIVGTTWQAWRAERARSDEAEQRLRAETKEREANEQRKKAEENLRFATKGNEILASVFASLNPNTNYATVADLRGAMCGNLQNAINELEGSAVGDPVTVALLQEHLAVALMGLGEAKSAAGVLEKTRATREEKLGPHHADTLRATNDLATAYAAIGKNDLAISLYESALPAMKTVHGPDDINTLTCANNLASAYLNLADLERAIPLLEDTCHRAKGSLGTSHTRTLMYLNNLAIAYQRANRMNLALPILKEIYDIRKANNGHDHLDTLMSMQNLAVAYSYVHQWESALPLLLQARESYHTKLGVDHPESIMVAVNLAWTYENTGKNAESVALLEETLIRRRRKLGIEHPNTLENEIALSNLYLKLGTDHAWLGRESERVQVCRQGLASAKGTKSPALAERVAKICSLRRLDDQKHREAALELGRLAVELGKQHPHLAYFRMAQGMAQYRAGQFAEACQTLDLGPPQGHVGGTAAFYRVMCLVQLGRKDVARKLFAEATARMKPLPKDEKQPLAVDTNRDDLIVWLAYKEARQLLGAP